jgi:hypothetical protein
MKTVFPFREGRAVAGELHKSSGGKNEASREAGVDCHFDSHRCHLDCSRDFIFKNSQNQPESQDVWNCQKFTLLTERPEE